MAFTQVAGPSGGGGMPGGMGGRGGGFGGGMPGGGMGGHGVGMQGGPRGMLQGAPKEQNSYDYDKQQAKYDEKTKKILSDEQYEGYLKLNPVCSTTPDPRISDAEAAGLTE